MDGGGGMDMDMGMSMTFAPFSSYQLQVVWGWWDVKTKGQYLATLLALAAAVVVHRYLVRCELQFVRAAATEGGKGGGAAGPMLTTIAGTTGTTTTNNSVELGEALLMGSNRGGGGGGGGRQGKGKSMRVPVGKRVVHAAFSAFLYAYALLLMLAAMTYNPGVFLALVVGYMVGDFFFSTRFDVAVAPRDPACCE